MIGPLVFPLWLVGQIVYQDYPDQEQFEVNLRSAGLIAPSIFAGVICYCVFAMLIGSGIAGLWRMVV